MQCWYYDKGVIYLLVYNKSAHCSSARPAFSFVLFYTFSDVWHSISSIRDRARGTSQLYLRVAWTSAFKQFFLFYSILFY